MFPPEETLGGSDGGDQAFANCRIALAALARATDSAGHALTLAFPSRQQEQLYVPLLEATGLGSAGIHPAVVGAGCRPQPPTEGEPPLVLLHWGDLKAGKGRTQALQVLQTLLTQGPPETLTSWGWLFHCHSAQALSPTERSLLERAETQELGLLWLRGSQSSEQMERLLARCPLALLAYDPRIYGQRSSGMLWQWAAARQALGRAAAAVGYAEGGLAREAPELGVSWSTPSRADGWLEALAEAARPESGKAQVSAYGQKVLGTSFPSWCADRLKESQRP